MKADEIQEEVLFNAARVLTDPGERAAFLNAACAHDPLLRQRIEALFAAQVGADRFFDRGPQDTGLPVSRSDSGRTTAADGEGPGDETVGSCIGGYKLLQRIGEGGWGVVYMAEPEKSASSRVALKVIKLGMDSRAVIARFEAERQALARMDHPNIARVLDAGTTASGRPYFVMELVRGTRITEFCDRECLATRDRLELMINVCHALQHAHQKGIIHRDLKPSNILVTINNGERMPKVIDFGIAKATDQKLTDKTLFTAYDQIIGTPAYMSPEQAAMTSLDVDTRTDVYSLGALLYELLAGRPPFDPAELLKLGGDEMRRAVREREPPRPSSRLATMSETELADAARHRRARPSELQQQLRGDLDWIAMKCLEKDRARRYETADALAMDLQRHLDDQPVVARPPGRMYQVMKYTRRHRTGVAAVVAVFVTLVAGLVFALSGYREALRAQRETERQRAAATQAQGMANLARDQAESLMAFMMQELTPALEQYGRLPLMERFAEKAVQYFDELPGELGGVQVERNRAAAVEALSAVRLVNGQDEAGLELRRQAVEARQRIAVASPDDPEAALEWEWAQLNLLNARRAGAPERLEFIRQSVGRVRELGRRFPENLAARRALARLLAAEGIVLAYELNRPHEGVVFAEEALAIFAELNVQQADDVRSFNDYANTIFKVALAYDRALDRDRATYLLTDLGTMADEALARDPGNVVLLEIAATVATELSYRLVPTSHQQSRDAEQVARKRWRTLTEFDPANPWYRNQYAWSHLIEAEYVHFQQGRIEKAREAYARFLTLLAPWARSRSDYEKLRQVYRAQARLAAQAGDRGRALSALESSREWQEKLVTQFRESAANDEGVRMRELFEHCSVLEPLRDWGEIERLARSYVAIADEALADDPGNKVVRVDRALANGWLGFALLRGGRAAAALEVLQLALADFAAATDVYHAYNDRGGAAKFTRELFAEALAATGDLAQARTLLEAQFAEREAEFASGAGYWSAHEALARAAWHLASVLDANDAVRRQTLLDCAAQILTAPGAEERLTLEDRDLLGQIEGLRRPRSP